jgi:hypothetical protein
MANQTPMAKEARLKDQLLRQLGFLERSAFAYDQGHKDEAIRMAGVMHTLFCSSKKSAGLVFQLHGKKIFLNSTCPRFDVEPLQFCGLVDFVFRRGQTEGEAVASLDGSNAPKDDYFMVCEFAQMRVKGVHLPALRQMTYELLTSPALRALAA